MTRAKPPTAAKHRPTPEQIRLVNAQAFSDGPAHISRYGVVFDALADRWAALEAEHDLVHPDRDHCGGVGSCSMMLRAHQLETEMTDALERWRTEG
jgi:hypothetical protein